MARKLTLTPDPTFKLKVGIPIPGESATAPVTFVVKRKKDHEVEEYRKAVFSGTENTGLIPRDKLHDVIVGWDLDDELTSENIDSLFDWYPGAALAFAVRYVDEHRSARLGN